MKKHLILIDDIEKLNTKKDTSLYLAHQMQSLGGECYLFYLKDIYLDNKNPTIIEAYTFKGKSFDDGFYLAELKIQNKVRVEIDQNCMIHMRLDPPYDQTYHRTLWYLDFWQKQTKCIVINRPSGIMQFNEKLTAYLRPNALESFITDSKHLLIDKIKSWMDQNYSSIIIKPLDLFSGIGVEKWDLGELKNDFDVLILEKIHGLNYHTYIIQPFVEKVKEGEVRSIFFGGQHLGSILKVPKSGEFLSNIAQGASFFETNLKPAVLKEATALANTLLQDGIYWIAYDILDDTISEVNLTCPGLLVELDFARKRSSVPQILDYLKALV